MDLTPKDLLGSERDGIHTLEDETKNEYSQLALNMSHFFNEETMMAGNAIISVLIKLLIMEI